MIEIKKILLIALGFFFLGLGILGIFLPLLPTVPFLLLSISCFYKSSERFHSWLLNHKIFGKIIKDYRENRKANPKITWTTLIVLWLTIGFSMYLFWHTVFVPILLFIIVVPVSLHILGLRLNKKKGN